MRRVPPLVLSAIAVVAAAYAQKYTGPPPPQADLPYIQHATNLIATEPAEAKELKTGSDTVYTVDGANSPAKTPLALPIFVIKADKVDPASLRMYRMAAKESRRELTASSKKTAEPIHVQVTKLSGDNLYQLDVYNSLDAGEYVFAAEGSLRMFCFQVY